MGRKVHPKIYRIGINQDWDSRFFASRWHFAPRLLIDELIRTYLGGSFAKGIIERVIVEHGSNTLKVIISTSRPGLVVGKQGAQIKQIEKKIREILELHQENIASPLSTKKASGQAQRKQKNVAIEIQEVKDPETSASLVSQEVALQLERRMPYRRTIKGMLGKLMRHKAIKGAKIKVKGRLGGAEIARSEWVSQGSVPLQTLRSDIDYGFCQAVTKFGTIGVKVWIYKGEVFGQKEAEASF